MSAYVMEQQRRTSFPNNTTDVVLLFSISSITSGVHIENLVLTKTLQSVVSISCTAWVSAEK